MTELFSFCKSVVAVFLFIQIVWAGFSPASYGENMGKWYVKYHQGFTIGMTEEGN